MECRKWIGFFYILLVSVVVAFPETRVVPMPGLVYPDELQVQGGKLYIGEFPIVKIYLLKDFKLLKRIGSEGEGPGEFTQYCIPVIVEDGLIVSSQGKVTFYSADGEYRFEKKVNVPGGSFKPAGGFYGVYAYAREKEEEYRAIDVYDSGFNKVRELYRFRLWLQMRGKKKNAFLIDSTRFRFKAMNRNLVWADMKEPGFHIWDSRSNTIRSIKRPMDPVKVTEKDKEGYLENLKLPNNRKFYQQIRSFIKFPEYFPPVKGLEASLDKIYVYTYQKKDELTEFLVFGSKGEFIKRCYLPLQGGIRPEQYPFCFGNDKLYQLVESEEGDDWELRITDI